ncbi:MAG: hypothetical protein L0Y44_07985 [Phycisphaerales bacterium]|nr:hypothetical protein [Phycisphaerales bacterium]MCI0630574.1 hypothetical protein [Phycisphaerales bacterium]MCI0676036.1 hypothetical protein [Phycisphaerales bacterium]
MVSRMKILTLFLIIAALGIGFGTPSEPQYTDDFLIHMCNFDNQGGNPYFNITPGAFRRLEGIDDVGAFVELEITALDATKDITFQAPNGEIMNVTARVVREKEWEDGALIEVSRNWFARCKATNDVFYFGEFVKIYEDGVVVSNEGSWEAGVDGAQPGVIMPSRYLLGARYMQEVAPTAMDRAKHTQMGLTVTVPAGAFTDCVKVVETTPLEPGSTSVKIYAPGVGLIVDGSLQLVEFQN